MLATRLQPRASGACSTTAPRMSGVCAAPPSSSRPSTWRRHMRSRALNSGMQGAHPSFDSEDDLDMGLADELQQLVNPKRAEQLANHLDLMWKIGGAKKRDKPKVCSCCKGTGETECEWCHGTGVLMIGDQLVCSTTDHRSQCPICKSAGYTKCEKCRGTGFRAQWLSDEPSSEQP